MAKRKKVLVLSEELARRIDEARGELSREEFIAFCLESVVSKTEEEEEVFCLIPEGTEIPSLPPLKEATYLPSPKVRGKEPSSKVREKETVPLGWWVGAILLFGFGDMLTTAAILRRGGIELNPIASFFLNLPGGIWTFALFKAVALISLIFLSPTFPRPLPWLIPLLITAAGSLLTFNNFLALLKP